MASVRLSDNLGVSIEVPVQSSLAKYVPHELVNLVALPNIRNELGQTLAATTLKPAGLGLDFKHKVELGAGEAELEIGAGLNGRLAIHKAGAQLFADDLIGDPVSIPDGSAYLAASLAARLKLGMSRELGDLTFGFDANSEVRFDSLQRFSADVTVQEALTASLARFNIPGDLDDLAALPPHAVCAASGAGSLTLTADVEVTAAPNPLAIPGLPAALPAVSVKAGASLGVSASFTIAGAYEVRVRKLGDARIRFGIYKRDQTEFSVGVEARAGIGFGVGKQDFIEPLLGAVSRSPKADLDELARAGLRPDHIQDIQDGIKAGIERSLAVSLEARLSTLKSGEAAFLYDIDLSALTAEGRRALNAALDADLSLLTARDDVAPLDGVTLRRSVFKETKAQGLTLRLNLLGILNLVSVSKLIMEGTVVTDLVTGEVTITDRVTAKRLRALLLNFGENQAKIRRLFFEAMVATVAYRASGIATVGVTSAHTYFELHQKTGRQEMKDNLEALEAVGLLTAGDKQARLHTAGRFGRSTLFIETAYDDKQCRKLFFDDAGKPRAEEHYENAARQALAALIAADDPDARRRAPAIDDALWAEMKSLGSPDPIKSLLRKRLGADTSLPLLAAIDGDYAFIAAFWARTMHQTAVKLAEVVAFLNENPSAGPDDNRFQKLRKELAKHLAEVASDTKERFGDPLGLVAMYYAAGRSAAVSAKLNCPLFLLDLPIVGTAGVNT
jgi:hypothetical protein